MKFISVQLVAVAVQQRLAQDGVTHDSDVYEVERTNSSKVPWLVVGPDGNCSIAHKLRVDRSSSDRKKQPLVRASCVQVSSC